MAWAIRNPPTNSFLLESLSLSLCIWYCLEFSSGKPTCSWTTTLGGGGRENTSPWWTDWTEEMTFYHAEYQHMFSCEVPLNVGIYCVHFVLVSPPQCGLVLVRVNSSLQSITCSIFVLFSICCFEHFCRSFQAVPPHQHFFSFPYFIQNGSSPQCDTNVLKFSNLGKIVSIRGPAICLLHFEAFDSDNFRPFQAIWSERDIGNSLLN